MNYKLEVIENNIVITFIEDNRKIIIDVTNSKEWNKQIENNSVNLKKLINRFDIINYPYISKSIKFSELLSYKRINFKYCINFIPRLLDKSIFLSKLEKSNLLNRFTIFLGIIILYLFYNIGYFFQGNLKKIYH